MQVTVKINADTPTGKRLIKQLNRYPETVTFDTPIVSDAAPEGYVSLEEGFNQVLNYVNPTVSNPVPEGYVTSKEFRKMVLTDTQEFCKKHGIL